MSENIIFKVTHEDGINKLIMIHSTEKLARYKIYKKLLFDCFGKEANEQYELLGTVTANDGLVCRFEDADCYRNDKPVAPTILSLYQTARDKYQVSIDSRCVGYKYEYYVTTDATGDIETSEKIRVTTNPPIKKYVYNIKRVENRYEDFSPNTDAKFIDMSSNSMTFELKNGHNVIFFKAINMFNNESYFSDVLCNIFEEDPYFPNRETNLSIPVGVRYNNRYRGPQESKKTDFFYMQIRNNLNKLKDRFKELDIIKEPMFEKPIYNASRVSQKIEDIEISLNEILEDRRYEQRNN